jgi:hypothetical protein
VDAVEADMGAEETREFTLFFSIRLRVDLAFEKSWACEIRPWGHGHAVRLWTGERHEQPGDDDWREYPLREEEFLTLVERAKALAVPAMPAYAMGYDADTWELTLRNGFNQTSFRWWSEVPEDWEEVERLAKRALSVVRLNCRGARGPGKDW